MSQGDQNFSSKILVIIGVMFVAIFAIVLVAAFALALREMPHRWVLGIGVTALVAGIVAVAIQGVDLESRLDARDAEAKSDPDDLMARHAAQSDSDRFVVRSYSLIVRPDLMARMAASYSVARIAALGANTTQRGLLRCDGAANVMPGDVTFASDATFLVVAQLGASDDLRVDVVEGRIASIMIGGGLLRLMPLRAPDFSGDTDVAASIMHDNDVYLVSGVGGPGTVPANAALIDTCVVPNILMPTGTNNVGAMQALSPLMVGVRAGAQEAVQVWGVGGR